jgi:predicted acylesterase/phospholipase RssA
MTTRIAGAIVGGRTDGTTSGERMTTTTDNDASLVSSRVSGGERHTTRRGRPRTAFVLSGGASLGALQVGMLRALYEHGITADLFVGTSIGA